MAYLRFVNNVILRERAEAAFARLERDDWGEAALHSVTDAGDAIEALLADRLLTIGVEGFDEEGILKMPLAALIDKAKGEMGEAAATFCDGVRLARDLVHSTRQARTGDALTYGHARAAHAVAELVRQEMAKYEPAPSAAQAAYTSIVRNPGMWNTVTELLAELAQTDRDELLLEVLPDQVSWIANADEADELDAELPLSRLMAGICLDSATPEVRSEFMGYLVRSLREARWDRPEALNRLRFFFFADHVADLPDPTRRWLRAFAVDVLKELTGPESPPWMSGLAAQVEPEEVPSVIRVMAYNAVLSDDAWQRDAGEEMLDAEVDALSGSRLDAAIEALDGFISSCEQHGKRAAADTLARMRYKARPIQDDEIPLTPSSD